MRLKSTTDLGIEQSDFCRVKLFWISPFVHFFNVLSFVESVKSFMLKNICFL